MTESPALLEWGRGLTEPTLREAIDSLPGSMRHVSGYHLGWWDADGNPQHGNSGKALRPTLALLAAEAVGGEASAATAAAVAVELVHNFSLIHDDIMDGDTLRRDRPATWTVFGTGPAMLAGNAMLTLAFDALAVGDHDVAAQASKMLNHAVVELLEGQAEDLAFEKRDDVEVAECFAMLRRKTAALLECAAGLGALLGGGSASQTRRLRSYAADLGLAFQTMDDVMGIWGDPARTGKPPFSDLRSRKKSLPVVAALASGTEAGRILAIEYHNGADTSALARLIEQAGAREWCLKRAEELTNRAIDMLAPPLDGALTSFARLITSWNP